MGYSFCQRDIESSVNDSVIKRLSLCKITAIFFFFNFFKFFFFAVMEKDRTVDGDFCLVTVLHAVLKSLQ